MAAEAAAPAPETSNPLKILTNPFVSIVSYDLLEDTKQLRFQRTFRRTVPNAVAVDVAFSARGTNLGIVVLLATGIR